MHQLYDPFARGRHPVGVRTVGARDPARARSFAVEIWYPAAALHGGEDLESATQDSFAVPGQDRPRIQQAVRDAESLEGLYPLVVLTHGSGGGRRMATYLCTHLASHGYVVAAMDHSETVAPELAPKPDESPEARSTRIAGWIANRVPDVRFLLDALLGGSVWNSKARIDPARIGITGHSFGGWCALAATGADVRIRAVVALAPGGSSIPKPGLIPATLSFDWGRAVPALYLVGENDILTPVAGIRELFERTPVPKQMLILSRADHAHFMDDAERMHELTRTMTWSGDLAWISSEIRPFAELCSEQQAHAFTRGHALAHFDAALNGRAEARAFLDAARDAAFRPHP